MLSRGKSEANVNRLKKLRLGVPKENKSNTDSTIGHYGEGKITNYLTAESLVDRLASKTKRKAYINKTDREYIRILTKRKDAESVKGKLS